MANLTVPDLVLRLTKGVPLVIAEMDGDLTILRDFCNALSDLLAGSLNADGSLKDDTVLTNALKDRAVTAAKLAATALPYFQDTGSLNTFVITPAPALLAYEEGQIFFIRAALANTGTATLNVNSLGVRPVRKRGGNELVAADIPVNSVFCVAYVLAANVFELVAGSGGGSDGVNGSASGFSGINLYAPPDADLPATAPTALATYTHNLLDIPELDLKLICLASELGFSSGQAVPIGEFVDATGQNPAFAIQVSATQLVVTMLNAPYVARVNAPIGTLTAVTLATVAWRLRVRAKVVTSVASAAFPATDYLLSRPVGVWANGNDIFCQNGSVAGDFRLLRIDANNNITLVSQPASEPNPKHINCAPFRLTRTGLDYFIFTGFATAEDIYQMPMVAPYRPVYWAAGLSGVTSQRKPLHLEDDVTGLQQVIAGGVRNEPITAVQCYARKTYDPLDGSGNVIAGVAGGVINFRSTQIFSAVTGLAGNGEFIALTSATDVLNTMQFNRVKRRIYIITEESWMLHIFEIFDVVTPAFIRPTNCFSEWVKNTLRYNFLKHMKSLAIAGLGGYIASGDDEVPYIDFDLATGAERAILFPRLSNGGGGTGYGGSITRIPWKE